MKNILLVLICFVGYHNLASQSCAPKGISTDPANPINPDPNGRLNTFDYTATGWPLRTEYLTEDTWKQSPFYSDNNSSIQHLYAPNDGVLDILPSNGWEIIKQDFGYLDNGQPAPEKAKNPFIVLYNRYTSFLRVFVAKYSQQSFNGANIRIRFTSDSPMQTSLLDMGSGVKALDAAFSRDQLINSIVNFPTGPFEWFYSDFQMQYDPCTCFFNSKMEINLSLSNSSAINLTGSSSGTIVSSGSPTPEQNDKGPLSFGDIFTGVKKGAQAYKSADKFKSDVQAAINKEGGTQQTPRTNGLADLTAKLATNSFLKAGLSTIPYLSFALTTLQSFLGGGKEGPQEVTVTPMTIKQTYDFTGSITAEYLNYTSITFRTPGSMTGNSPLSQYPYYNEVLGIFNIINTPKFKRTLLGSTEQRSAKFTLANDVDYVLNPAAKLNIQQIAAYVLVRDQQAETVPLPLSPTSPDVEIGYTAHAGPTPDVVGFMIVLNLARQNTNASTQNVLLSFRYPFNYVASVTKTGAKLKPATNVDSFCTGSTYASSTRFPAGRTYEEGVKELEKNEWRLEKEKEQGQIHDGRRIYPNPSGNKLFVQYDVKSATAVKIYLFNSIGHTISMLKETNLMEGAYEEEFDITSIPDGIYYLTIDIGGVKTIEKIVVRR